MALRPGTILALAIFYAINVIIFVWVYQRSCTPAPCPTRRVLPESTLSTLPLRNATLPHRRFLMLFDIWYREQLTQFRLVVMQALKLAKMTNRVFVLPYVAKSHIWPPNARGHSDLGDRPLYNFTAYFDINFDLGYVTPDDVIEMEDYLRITNVNRDVVVMYCMCWENFCGGKFARKNCQTERGGWMANQIKDVTKGYFRVKENVCFTLADLKPENVLNMLNEEFRDYDVGFAYYHKRLLDNDGIPPDLIKFSSHVIRAAQVFREETMQGKFLALHWRFEKTRIMNVVRLLPAVVGAVEKAMADNGFTKLFIATEYATGASDSWAAAQRNEKKPHYDKMVATLRASFDVYEGYQGQIKDEGFVAMVDRLMCEDADVFMPVDYASSFTRAIVDARDKQKRTNDLSVYHNYEWEMSQDVIRRLESLYTKSELITKKKEDKVSVAVFTSKDRLARNVLPQLSTWVHGHESNVAYFSDTEDAKVGAIKIPNVFSPVCEGSGAAVSSCKLVWALKWFVNRGMHRWLLVAGDASYVQMDNVNEFCNSWYDNATAVSMVVGERFCHEAGFTYPSAKAGFLVSQRFAREFDPGMFLNEVVREAPANASFEVLVGYYLQRNNLTLVHHNGFSTVPLSEKSDVFSYFKAKASPWALPFVPMAYNQEDALDFMKLMHEWMEAQSFSPTAKELVPVPKCQCFPQGTRNTRCLSSESKISTCASGVSEMMCIL